MSELKKMHEFVESINPLSGPNILLHASIVDNDDGTMTFKRSLPFPLPVEPDFEWAAQQTPRLQEIEGINQVTGERYCVVWHEEMQSYRPKADDKGRDPMQAVRDLCK